jgi:hypothetical protein
MKSFSLFLIAVLFITSCTSCKEDDPTTPTNNCIGGKGGAVTFEVKTIHHIREIKGCTIYIKYNAQDFPGENASNYDYVFKADDSMSISYTDSMKCGKYYLFATGIDSLLSPPNNIVKGGVPINISQIQDTARINLYVTEGD